MAEPSIAQLVVPAAAALGGVALGKAWDIVADTVRWKRQQRADAYSRFMAAAEAAYVEMAQVSEDFKKAALHDCIQEMTRASAAIDVFGDGDVARSAHTVWNFAVFDLADDALVAMNLETWGRKSDEYRKLIGQFRDAARKDLKGKPLGSGRTPAAPGRGSFRPLP